MDQAKRIHRDAEWWNRCACSTLHHSPIEEYAVIKPAGWTCKRFDEFGTLFSGATPRTGIAAYWDGDIVWVTPNDVSRLRSPYLFGSAKTLSEKGLNSCSAQLLPGRSIVMSSRAPIGYVAIPVMDFCTNQGCKSIKLKQGYDPEFAYYSILHNIDAIKNRGEGTTFAEISKTALASVALPFPDSKPEQTKIAEILSTVDRAIEQTEALIAKQQRIKTGLMQDLLTRGIDEHGNLRSEETHEFKDSPLGRMPVEWNSHHLSEIADLQVGYAFKSSWFSETGIRLLRGENVGTGTPDWKDTQRLTPDRVKDFEEYLLCPGDFVIGMDRTFTQQGFKLTQLSRDDTPSLLVQRVGRFIAQRVPTAFLSVVIRSPAYRRELQLKQKGMDIPHLSRSEILSPIVAVPSSETEMQRIAEQVEKSYRLQAHYQSALEKAQRLKLALMQDLLTGRKRVTPLLEPESPAPATP
ncbi:MAG: hypothetical protein N838_19420 [Thiohalocapsa sp. PB-PSB1]|nr:MAG: hypothetical protein N838_19420 [Thiohalocapsa sp. PB-PSB1]